MANTHHHHRFKPNSYQGLVVDGNVEKSAKRSRASLPRDNADELLFSTSLTELQPCAKKVKPELDLGDETEEDDICPVCDGDCNCKAVSPPTPMVAPVKPTRVILIPPKALPPPTFEIKVAKNTPKKKTNKKKQKKKKVQVQVVEPNPWDSDATSIDLEHDGLNFMLDIVDAPNRDDLSIDDGYEEDLEAFESEDQDSDFEQQLLEHVAYPGLYKLESVAQDTWEAMSNFDEVELDSEELFFTESNPERHGSTPRSYFLVDDDPEEMARLVKQAKAALHTLKSSPWMYQEEKESELAQSVQSTAPLPLEAVVDLTCVDEGPFDSATAHSSIATSTNSEVDSVTDEDHHAPHMRLRALSLAGAESRPASPNALRQNRAGDVMLGKMEPAKPITFAFGTSLTSPGRSSAKRELQPPTAMLPEQKVTIFPSLDEHLSDFWTIRNHELSDSSDDDVRQTESDGIWAKAYAKHDQRQKQLRHETFHSTSKRESKEKKIAKKALDKLRLAKDIQRDRF